MIRLLVMTVLSGSTFTMCDGGPVPDGCCERGDTLNVIVVGDDSEQRCADMGGELSGIVCMDVDF